MDPVYEIYSNFEPVVVRDTGWLYQRGTRESPPVYSIESCGPQGGSKLERHSERSPRYSSCEAKAVEASKEDEEATCDGRRCGCRRRRWVGLQEEEEEVRPLVYV